VTNNHQSPDNSLQQHCSFGRSAAVSNLMSSAPLPGSIKGLHFNPGMSAVPDVHVDAVWGQGAQQARAQQQAASVQNSSKKAAVDIQQSSAAQAAIDLTAGTVAGVAQLIVGHPFDTIKVRSTPSGMGPVVGRLWSTRTRIFDLVCVAHDAVLQVKLQSQSSAAGAAVFNGPLDAAKQVCHHIYLPDPCAMCTFGSSCVVRMSAATAVPYACGSFSAHIATPAGACNLVAHG
jgi:hypothetical protein